MRIVLHLSLQKIEKRRLQTAEAVVIALYVGLVELKGMGIPLPRQTINDGAARIAQSHELGALVYRLTSGIVDGLSQYLHVIIGIDPHNLGIAPADQETQERILG